MPSAASWAVFVLASAGLILVPGPNVVFLLAQSVRHGRSATLRCLIGVETATLVMALATAVGLAQVIAASSVAFAVLRWGGALYLFWLGFRALRGSGHLDLDPGHVPVTPAGRRMFTEGFLVGFANPKVALFFVAFLPQFVTHSAPAGPQLAALGVTFTAIGLALDLVWVLASSSVAARLRRDRRLATRISRGSGLVYFGLGGWALATGQRPS